MDQLAQWLKDIGVGPTTGFVIWLAVTVGIAGIRGLYTLSIGSNSRRKEFVEMYEKHLSAKDDPLLLEAVVRHGFGLWLPSELIKRIRASKAPAQRLLALANVMPFLDTNEVDGTLVIKRRFAGEPRRDTQIVMRLAGYFLSVFPVVIAVRLIGDLEEPMLITLCGLIAVVFTILCFYLLDSAAELSRLSSIVARYPDLFDRDADCTSSLRTEASMAIRSPIARSISRLMFWTKNSLRRRPQVQREALASEAASNRSISTPSTPHA